MASSPQFAIDFDNSKTSAFMDSVDSTFNYLENGLEYLQPYPQSPAFGVSIGLPSPPLNFNTLNLPNTIGDYTYSSSPARPYTPPDGASIAPPALGGGYTLSAGELSSDSMPPASGRHSRGSGTHSPPASIPYAATVPRSHRYNPIVPPATRASVRGHKRRSSRSNDDSDEEDDDFQPSNSNAGSPDSRRETIRKQRIESEQRRRDELRDGYARLKETLPASNQKSSKVSLLDRATSHLRYLDTVREQLENRLKAAESEVHRLRSVNEALMLNAARHPMGGNVAPTASF
jgi:hypothetical protein